MVERHLLLLLLVPLAWASLLDKSANNARTSFLETVLESTARDYCKPTGIIQDACCDFETIEQVNRKLSNTLMDLVQTPFFRYHKVDLYRECPFWKEDGSCMNRACGVETTSEDHIPVEWRSAKLGALESDPSATTAPVPELSCASDPNFCVLDDDPLSSSPSSSSSAQYVDLLANPERFTGYAGASSSRVWKSIYEENCFTPVRFIDPSRSTSEGGAGFAPIGLMSSANAMGLLGGGGAGFRAEEKKILDSLVAPRDGDNESGNGAAADEVCLEKRVFYRLISGLHASISIHICDDYLDQKTGLWSPNLQCFITRIAQHPERLQNVYFTYVLLLRALAASGDQILATLDATSPTSSSTASFSVESATTGAGAGSMKDDTREQVVRLIEVAKGCENTFDETSMFTGRDSEILKDQFKSHFRNISLIMDCVGCDKCRLWGKLQITGLGTGLKLLFSNSNGGSPSHSPHVHPHPPPSLSSSSSVPASSPSPAPSSPLQPPLQLTRGEVVAFVNTLHRFSESLRSVDKFRALWNVRDDLATTKEEEDAATVVELKEEAVESLAVAEEASRSKGGSPTTKSERAVEEAGQVDDASIDAVLEGEVVNASGSEEETSIASERSSKATFPISASASVSASTSQGSDIAESGSEAVEVDLPSHPASSSADFPSPSASASPIEWSRSMLSNLSVACIDRWRSCIELVSGSISIPRRSYGIRVGEEGKVEL